MSDVLSVGWGLKGLFRDALEEGWGGGLGPKSVGTKNGPTRFFQRQISSRGRGGGTPPHPPTVPGHSNTSLGLFHPFFDARQSSCGSYCRDCAFPEQLGKQVPDTRRETPLRLPVVVVSAPPHFHAFLGGGSGTVLYISGGRGGPGLCRSCAAHLLH